MSPAETLPATLDELETRLRTSHDNDAADLIRLFSGSLGSTKKRQETFNAPGALLRRPITYADAVAEGILNPDAADDVFTCLQGDVIETDAAFFWGSRVTDGRYVIASSTCDLTANRREYALLFRVFPLTSESPNIKQRLGELLTFKSTKHLYLPPTYMDVRDGTNVIAQEVFLDGVALIRNEALQLATRSASMSLVGWRMFGSLTRQLFTRTTANETSLRVAFDS